MIRIRIAALFCLPMLIGAAASAASPDGAHPLPVTDFNHRYQPKFGGFSVMPPRGKDWLFQPTDDAGVAGKKMLVFRKIRSDLKPVDRNLYAANARVYLTPFDVAFKNPRDLLEQVGALLEREQRQKSADIMNGGLPLLKYERSIAKLGDRECLRFDFVNEDQADGEYPTRRFTAATHGYACPHPQWPRLMVRMEYRQRTPKGERVIPLGPELAHVFNSLKFLPLPYDTTARVRTIAVAKFPVAVASGSNALWVANRDDRSVWKIALDGSRVSEKISVGEQPVGIAVSGGAVWVTHYAGNSVSRINPQTHQIDKIMVGRGPIGLVEAAGSLWVANNTDGSISRIDPSTNDAAGKPVAVEKNPDQMIFGAGSLWVANRGSGTVSRIDPEAGTSKSIRVGEIPGSLAFGVDSIWVGNQKDKTISRINATTDTVVATISLPGTPMGVEFHNGRLWVTQEDWTVIRIDAKTNEMDSKPILLGARPTRIQAVNGALWVVNSLSNTVWRIAPDKALGEGHAK